MELQENSNYDIIWTDTFKQELVAIYYYILYKLREPSIAKKFYSNVINQLDTLKQFPEKFPRLFLNQNNLNIRKMNINNYIIIYNVENQINRVSILHIFNR